MKYIVLIFIAMVTAMSITTDPLVYDFGEGKIFGRWTIINDDVMGGLSDANARVNKNSVFLNGYVSLKNNGGFVSLRGPVGKYDLSKYSLCEIRYKATNDRIFEVLLERETPFYLPKFRAKFASTKDDWETIIIPLKDFEISRMGNTVQEGIDVNELKIIQRIGFILSDKKEGDFTLEIDYLKFY